MENSESAAQRSSEEDWHKYSLSHLSNYCYADRIEFNRGSYSHWALYVNNGQVVHLNPANCSENVGPLIMAKWFNGAVTRDNLRTVAGNDDIRVVRGNLDESRPRADVEMLIDITVEKPIFKYCLGRFNCEHFVNFIKFGKPVSSQILLIEALNMLIKPSILGLRVDPMEAVTKLAIMSQRQKLKTKPESTNVSERKQELFEICIQVAKEVQERPREEIEKYLFW